MPHLLPRITLRHFHLPKWQTSAADAAKEIAEGQQAIPIITTNPFSVENTTGAQDYFFELLSGESLGIGKRAKHR